MKKLLFSYLGAMAVGSCMLFSSCSSTSKFTQAYREKIEAAGGDLKDIQFYNNEKIVLQSTISSTQMATAKGKIKIKEGKMVETITIPKKTPGVCIQDNGNWVLISFDTDDSLNIRFWGDKAKTAYKIADQEGWLVFKEKGLQEINYGENLYQVMEGSNADLMIKPDEKSSSQKASRKVKGRKLM
ncbi:hypothetical protein [Persicobacter diffluens]|uniref:Lipoprotein n=1 Tax=Persicobacter diffluens TaxID=981 RepID=A0AAN4W1L8_9BACT|nr:hypothetical protein PEDI_45630 [Persicobacter diffluens]